MDREGVLPHRCIVCNAAADNRFALTLYASPLAWRICALATPFLFLGTGVATKTSLLSSLFLPAALVLMIAHTFVRKKIEVELSICQRHRRRRALLGALSFGSLVLVAAAAMTPEIGFPLLVPAVLVLLALTVVWANTGIQAVTVSKVTDQHLWLARTGKAFRFALPELPAKG
jgi:hypothetical protein